MIDSQDPSARALETAILRARRRQVQSVALGTLGGSCVLAGAVIGSTWLFVGGAILFAACLLSIFFWGARAARLYRSWRSVDE